MIKILITGKDSYIGTSVESWLIKKPDKYKIDTVDMKDNSWKDKDFSDYDVVFHVAGIAHIKETKRNCNLYIKVNKDLVYETAYKAKTEGVKQFIFLSSMSVYGIEKGRIDINTLHNPNNYYGRTKLEAEELIINLEDENFKIAIIRPPMVYGKDCKGNYIRLAKLAQKTPIFPNINNKRSMIFIDNLSEFVMKLIDSRRGGVFFPQNAQYVNTSEMVELIANAHGKRVKMTKFFNPLLKVLNITTVNKMFGDLIYDMTMSEYEYDYRVHEFRESIIMTESDENEKK